MPRRYYEIPKSTFDGLVTESGILLKRFDIDAAISDPATPGYENEDIICATTGGITISLKPAYSDFGEDVDNCPPNMKELKHLDSWEAKISTTGLGVTAENIRDALGAADIDSTGQKITPRIALDNSSDFHTIYWVSDKANGGFIVAVLDNALSTEGLELQTGKNTKGQTTIAFVGHVSINAQDVVPMHFYSIDPPEPVKYTVKFDTDGGSAIDDEEVESGGSVTRPADPVKAGYVFDGWYSDTAKTAPFDFATSIVLADFTIYAKWAVAVTVSFDTDGGSTIADDVIPSGGVPTVPDPPVKMGATFDGWYTDDTYATTYDFTAPVTADTTIYAKWV